MPVAAPSDTCFDAHPAPRAAGGPLIFLFFLSLALASCGGEGAVPDRPLGTPPPPPTRPSDGLLDAPELQQIVDLQVARDGAGVAAFLDSPDSRLRARAAFALGSVQDPEAGPALVALLRDPSADVRRDAAFALGQMPDARSAPALLAALRVEREESVRLRLLEALGKVGDERTLEALVDTEVAEEEQGAKTLAIARLGIRGVSLPTAVEYLLHTLSSEDPAARLAAAYYFGRNPQAGQWAARAGRVRSALDSLPPSDLMASHLLLGLSLLGDPQDTPRFLWWLRSSPDWRIRANAARAMNGRAGDPRVRSALMEALEDPSTHVAVYAADALSGTDRLTPPERDRLKRWVEDHPREWRRAGPILALLGRSGEGEFLEKWLESWPDEEVPPRTRGLGALAFVPGERATAVLMAAAGSTNPRIRGTALGGLARRWRIDRQDPNKLEPYYRVFLSGLRTGDPAAVYVAAPALADSAFLPLGSVEVLIAEYHSLQVPDDREAMQAILTALGETGASQAEAFLAEEAASGEPSIREIAARALAALRGGETAPPGAGAESGRVVDWGHLARLGSRPRLVLETDKGRVVLVLDAESAPLTVETIAGFAERGKYDGVPFHRVVPNFVVQGGDFARHDGFGGPGFAIRSEFTEVPFLRGVVGMASSGKDTEGSQFFITHSMQPHLDGAYTAFGWVAEGMDVVDRLYEEDRIVRATVESDRL